MIQRILRSGIAALALALPMIATADEGNVRKGIEAFFGKDVKVDAVRKAGFLNLYEVQVGGEMIYTDEKVTHVLIGNVHDVKANKDLTGTRKFSLLPLELTIKQVRGDGKRTLVTFEDPNCGYCKKLAQEIQKLNNVTVHTFLYPVLGEDSHEKSKAIWCSADRAKAWNEWMLNGKEAGKASAKCDITGLEKSIETGRKLGIRGTPALFFSDGGRVPGYMPGPQLDQAISRASSGN